MEVDIIAAMNLESSGISGIDENAVGLTQDQYLAIKREEELAHQLISDGRTEEVLTMFRDSILPDMPLLSYLDMARVVLPEIADTFPNIAAGAVYRTVKLSVDPEERQRVTRERKKLFFLRSMVNTDPAVIEAGKVQARKTKRENLRSGKKKNNVAAMHEATGAVLWTEDEDTLLRLLLGSSDFRYTADSNHAGKYNWHKIEGFWNRITHEKGHGRSVNSLRGYAKAKGIIK